MQETDNTNFSASARKALIDKKWSVKDLADRIKRPASTVSRALHTEAFPLVRKQITKALNLTAAL